jgi:uncharacterized protein YecT (DUF1311 family)
MRNFFLVLLWLPLLADADSTKVCSPRQSWPEHTTCLDEEAKRQDKLLLIEFQKALKRANSHDAMSPEDREKLGKLLRGAQSRWTHFRESECEAYRASFGPGNGATIGYLECVIDHTKTRRAHLAKYW